MKTQIRLSVFFVTLGLLSALQGLRLSTNAQESLPLRKTYQFINGQWFDGKGFRRQIFYSANGVLTRKKPAKVGEVVDLGNGYVVPPFADAHCHHFDNPGNVAQQVGMYLRDGVFYAKVQTDVRSGALQVTGKVNRPTSVDVFYAHGALTSSYGHGVEVYEGLSYYSTIAPEASMPNKQKGCARVTCAKTMPTTS